MVRRHLSFIEASVRWRDRFTFALVAASLSLVIAVGTVAAAGQVVSWSGSGATNGLCNNVTGTGSTQTWSFHMTQPFGPTGSTLDATFESGTVEAKASLTTNLAGMNDDLTYVAKVAGAAGNAITIEYVAPTGVANSPLSVTTIGTAMIISAATNGAGSLVSTASDVVLAVSAHPASMVDVSLAAGNDGTGLIGAMPPTNLSGGGPVPGTITVSASGAKVGGGNSPYAYTVDSPAGARLLSASATNGTSKSNLNLGGCTLSN